MNNIIFKVFQLYHLTRRSNHHSSARRENVVDQPESIDQYITTEGAHQESSSVQKPLNLMKRPPPESTYLCDSTVVAPNQPQQLSSGSVLGKSRKLNLCPQDKPISPEVEPRKSTALEDDEICMRKNLKNVAQIPSTEETDRHKKIWAYVPAQGGRGPRPYSWQWVSRASRPDLPGLFEE